MNFVKQEIAIPLLAWYAESPEESTDKFLELMWIFC